MAAKVCWYREAWWVRTRWGGNKKKDRRIGRTKAHKREAEAIARTINAALALGSFGQDAERGKPLHCDAELRRWLRTYSPTMNVLDMTVEKSTELSGQAKVELEMKSEGERVVLLSLDPTLRVSEVTNSDGHPLNFFQPRDPKDDFFLGDYLAVVSPSPFPKGAVTLGFRTDI